MVDANRAPGYFTSIYKAGFAGGLYTQASPLSVPEGYSPAMENVFLNRRNNIRTRFGTQELLASIPENSYLYVIRTKFNVTLLITKEGLDLNVYRITEVTDKELNCELLESFTNVWSEEAELSVPDFILLSGAQPFVIITTGTNTPVQVRIAERQIVNRTPSAVLTLQNEVEFSSAVSSDIIVIRNGVILPTSDYTFSGNQIILGAALTGVFDILYIGWYWFTEAAASYGFQLAQTVSRFNTGPSDLSLAIPLDLLVGIRPVPLTEGALALYPYKNGLRAGSLNYLNPPVAENDFTYSGGSFRTTENSEKILPGISHVTFGAVNADETDISELTFVRGVNLNFFNGSDRLPATSFNVFVDDELSTFSLGAAAGDYGDAYNVFDAGFVEVVSDTDLASYVMFQATANVGLTYGSVIRTLRRSAAPTSSNVSIIGSAANNNSNTLPYAVCTRGNPWPLYGIQEHADFRNGSFPSTVELHENRLVFSGFPGNSDRVVFSAVLDTTIVDDFYSDFQISEQEGLDVNAVVLDINTTDASGITAIKSASGTFFVFTMNAVYLVSGGERGITPSNKFVTQIAGVGAVNSRCVIVINNSVLFLSRSGIYGLAQSFDAAGGWRVQPISEPVNDRMQNPANSEVAWMTFLPNEDTLYVCVAEEGTEEANDLYLWKQDINSWSKFTDYTGFWRSSSGKFADLTQNYLLMAKQGRLISYPYKYPIDHITAAPNPLTFSDYSIREVQTLPFKTIPDVGVPDVGIVGLITVTKLNSTQVFIDSDDPTSSYIYPSTVGSDLVVVYNQDGRKSTVTYDVETGLVGEVDETDSIGYIYKCFAATPNLFVASDKPPSYLPSNKTVHTCYFVFHTNGEYRQFGVNLKKVDVDPTQVTPLNKFPSVDFDTVAFDAVVLDAARQLVRPFWKIAMHPGGIEDFYQMIVLSDSVTEWELVSLQTTVSQSSVRPGVGRI
jgi:hypothetical protein